jgi:hypothetical protein
LSAAITVGAALPARADPARASNYRSEVTAIEPSTPGLDAQVVGGDAFLELSVGPGLEVTVFGYGGEPYLRIDGDGRIRVNTNSPAFYLNDDRYALVEVPTTASIDAAPAWVDAGEGGVYGWHDHRIHWMAPEPPPGIERDKESEIQTWNVPLEVNGQAASVSGQLVWIPAASPLPWFAFLLGAVVGLVFLAPQFPRARVAILALGSLAGLAVGLAEVIAAPPGSGGAILAIGPPALALLLGGFALLAPMAAAIGAVLLIAWSTLRISALWLPSLPSNLPEGLERSLIVVAAATAATLLILVFRARGRQVPREPG